eukprot:CAMPEP_0198155492 /NCGR_PEP_ID=MMETSP1443-20131203/69164_1 /TAXON_ID=186043 /ORGANISM="Entomoneis sp., Strain CCMP2396" /LENGTH=152 /DNA_ID=CAMNT_0043822243 /DNA_START=219 /DNA_END=678 /DNA_ORIENTATION=+
MSDTEQVRGNIETLGICPLDLERCKSLEEEYTIILRRSSDLKNCSDPSIYGYASRIREIIKAEKTLHQKLEDTEEVRGDIGTLGIYPLDLERCKSLKGEYTIILRRSSDVKNCSDPSIYGYASRIRKIIKAEKTLHEKLELAEFDYFCEYLE